jgi:hypothetical protein
MSALKKTTHEEQGGVYVGVLAAPTPQHSGPPLAVDLFSVDSLIQNRARNPFARYASSSTLFYKDDKASEGPESSSGSVPSSSC